MKIEKQSPHRLFASRSALRWAKTGSLRQRLTKAGFAVLLCASTAQFTFSATINGTGWKGTVNNGTANTGNWSNSGNWDSTGPASDERNLFFGNGYKTAGGTNFIANNDIAAFTGYRITFESVTPAVSFTLQGNAITLADFGGGQSKIENQSTVNQNLNFGGLQFGGSLTFAEINAVNGGLTFGSSDTIGFSGSVAGIKLFGSGQTVTFNDTVNGSGKYFAITTGGTGNTININGSFTAADFYVMNGGTVNLNTGANFNSTNIRLGGDFGTTGNQDQTKSGTFQLTSTVGGQTISGVINSTAGNTSNALAVNSLNTSNTNTIAGHIALDSALTFNQSAGGTWAITQGRSTAGGTTAGTDVKAQTLTFAGAGNFIVGPATPTGFGTIYDSLSGVGGTAIIMNGTGSLSFNDANSYRGKTQINSGTLFVGANNALGSSNGTVGTIGNTVLLGNTSGSSNATLLTTGAFTIANAITLQSGNTGGITLGGNSANTSIYSGAINLGTASGTAKNGTFVALAGGSVDFQGLIDENTSVPASGVTIGDATHSGTVKFSNTGNGYGGVTTVTNGATLEVTSLGTAGNSSIGNSTRSTASNLVLSNGTLKYTGAGETTGRSFTFDANGGTLDASAAANAALIYTGTAVASGTGNRTLALTGTSTGANALQLVLANPSSGTTALTKNGGGTWQLTGTTANTYTGVTTVSNGELDLSKTAGQNAIGGNVTINGGTLKWLASNQVVDTSMITLSSGALSLNGFTETVNDLNNTGGTFTTGAGTWTGTGASMTWAGGTNTINTGGTIFENHLTITAGTNEVQAGGLVQLSLTGLSMNGGTVTLDADPTTPGKLSLMSNVAATDGTTSTIATSNPTNAGVVDLNGGTRTFTIGTSNAATTLNVSANIIGTGGAIIKAGPGSLVLTGNNTYTGATTINGGTLNAGAAGALGLTSSIAVNSGGTLLLSGSGNLNRVNNAAGIALNNGTLARTGTASEGVGASRNGVTVTGTSSVGLGALTLNSTSSLDFGTGGVGTLVFASFTPGIGNVLNILDYTNTHANPLTLVSGIDGSDDRLIFNSDQAANLASFNFGTGLTADEIALDSGFFEIVAVPEPRTWAAGALAFAGLVLSQRRRIVRLTKRA